MLPFYLLALGLQLGRSGGQIIPGTPPAFPSTDDPRDQFVFEVDADGNKVSLLFDCPVEGTGPPEINWYRNVAGVFMEDNDNIAKNGSYIFPNITAADSAYANGDGVQYYCTATNAFGTIRSRTVRAFYAEFKGFAVDGTPVAEDAEPVERSVDVIQVGTRLQWVALECEVVAGSTPTPAIEWIRRDVGAESGVPLTEDFMENKVRFLDGGQWLILETEASAISGKEYYCQVTNKLRFQTVRGPITYTLNPVTSFPDEPDGIKIYKPLTNRAVARVAFDASAPANSPLRVAFGTGIAYNGTVDFTQTLEINDGPAGVRATGTGPVRSILPSFTPSDTASVLRIRMIVAPTPDEQETQLEATLTLLDPAVLVDPLPANVDDKLSNEEQTFTCNAGGSTPTITFFHNGAILESGGGITISGGTLTINPTSTANSGMYQCLVENGSGSNETSWFLIVRDPIKPKIVSSHLVDPEPCLGIPLIQRDDPSIVLSVNVTADPCPSAVWTLDGEPLAADATGLTVSTFTDGCSEATLGRTSYLFSLTVDPLQGQPLRAFGVTFTNAGGSTPVDPVTVTGRVRADIMDLRTDPHSPIEGTDTGCLSAGSNVKIICQNVAYPVATVEFLKDGATINVGADDRLEQVCDTLTITGVVAEDKGTYTCAVDNDDTHQDEDRSGLLKLDYCIVPSIVGDLTFTRKNPDEGEETTASCEWTGSPDPMVTWFKDGAPLREEDLPFRMRITETTSEAGNRRSNLEIDQVELSDTGDYTCNVSNPVGYVTRFSRLEVQATSGRPSAELTLTTLTTQSSPPLCTNTASQKSDDNPDSQISAAVGLGVGLAVLGLFIFLSVLAVLFFLWRVNKLKVDTKLAVAQGGTYTELNKARTGEMEMTENVPHTPQNTYD